MDETNVLITGANSQLALTLKELVDSTPSSVNFIFKNRHQLDITSQKSIDQAFDEKTYKYCVNCAAYTDVEGAESNRKEAFSINSNGVGFLAKSCVERGVVLIHISTDYVFDGESSTPYKEEDKTNPINVYGESKLSGENIIRGLMNKYFIIRTSWLYSSYGKNFVKTMIANFKENKPLTVITSQTGTPTSCIDLGNFIIGLIMSEEQQFGTYHFSALGATNWFGFAKHIASHIENYDLTNLKPIDSYPTKATRPLYSVFDLTKVSSIYTLTDWQSSVDAISSKILSKPSSAGDFND